MVSLFVQTFNIKGINYFYFLLNDKHACVITYLMDTIQKHIKSNNQTDIRCNKCVATILPSKPNIKRSAFSKRFCPYFHIVCFNFNETEYESS